MKIPNALIHSSSPYLLQHAYNPVQWFPWGEEALQRAREENKLLLISIGYSACHWCHVMEHESFEDEEVATVMNKSFVCIKVDREERPDIDQVYMDAVQLMTGRGGWPLHVIALPDQRPVYGGTYFPKESWRQILLQLAALYRNDPAQCHRYASELTEGVNRISQVIPAVDDAVRNYPDHQALLLKWSKQWDREEGGPLRAPKFPLPDSIRYLLAAAYITNDEEALGQVALTLKKIAYGGIYDQVGGGFARYSTDMHWKVPHFEKMLYDNAQLVSLYAEAFKWKRDSLYEEVVYQTLAFVEREMTTPLGGFYAALDADTEGEEGKFYCWNLDEVRELTGDDFQLAVAYFNFNERGYWEHDRYIPLRHLSDEEIAGRFQLSVPALKQRIAHLKELLFNRRAQRIRPGLDNKILCSWNGLMISGYLDAYTAFGDERFLKAALRAAEFINKHLFSGEKHLFHSAHEKNGEVTASISGFLEDYAFVIEAFLSVYSVTMETSWLTRATRLCQTALEEFHDEKTGLFWFTSSLSGQLFSRKQEVQDNVIPSSNAVMSDNLMRLSKMLGNGDFETKSRRMLNGVKNEIEQSTPWYSRWAKVALEWEHGTEIALCGDKADQLLKELLAHYLPLAVVAASTEVSDIGLLRHRFKKTENLIYVCRNQTCQAPVSSVAQAMASVRS